VTHVVTDAKGVKNVEQIPSTVTLTASGDWKTIGAYGPTQCAKLLSPLPPPNPTPADAIQYPALSSCVDPGSCDLKGDSSGKYTAQVSLDKTTYSSSDVVNLSYSGMPDLDGNWITIVPKGYPDNSWCSWSWAAGASGSQIYAALPPGPYEVRAYYNWTGGSGSGGGQCEVIGRESFTVSP
jgi:hypothetical protein